MEKHPRENPKHHEVYIRELVPADRRRIAEMVVSSGNFNDVEIATALELIDEALEEGEKSGYMIVVLEDGKNPVVKGYACYGPTPLTQGVYDLYWIVVDPTAQGKGFGRRPAQVCRAGCSEAGRTHAPDRNLIPGDLWRYHPILRAKRVRVGCPHQEFLPNRG